MRSQSKGGGGGEEELRTKLPVLKTQHLKVVNVSVVAVIAQSSAHHPLPPPKKRNWQNCCFVSLKTFEKSAQNRPLSSEICPEKFHKV